jgi:two-component system cell cycle sensor histidine kinase/response regulator CckA
MADERILVVDDEDLNREIICSVLCQAGCECHWVNSGTEALAVLRSDGGYSVVLSKVIMEGMDGLTLLSQIRKTHPDLSRFSPLNRISSLAFRKASI